MKIAETATGSQNLGSLQALPPSVSIQDHFVRHSPLMGHMNRNRKLGPIRSEKERFLNV